MPYRALNLPREVDRLIMKAAKERNSSHATIMREAMETWLELNTREPILEEENMAMGRFLLNAPKELIKRIDGLATKCCCNRSEYMRQLMLKAVEEQDAKDKLLKEIERLNALIASSSLSDAPAP